MRDPQFDLARRVEAIHLGLGELHVDARQVDLHMACSSLGKQLPIWRLHWAFEPIAIGARPYCPLLSMPNWRRPGCQFWSPMPEGVRNNV